MQYKILQHCNLKEVSNIQQNLNYSTTKSLIRKLQHNLLVFFNTIWLSQMLNKRTGRLTKTSKLHGLKQSLTEVQNSRSLTCNFYELLLPCQSSMYMTLWNLWLWRHYKVLRLKLCLLPIKLLLLLLNCAHDSTMHPHPSPSCTCYRC